MSLADIKAQFAKLEREAEVLIKAKKSTLIEDMKKNIADYGITADELGFGGPAKAPSNSKRTAPKAKAPVKYKNDEGKTRSGRQGPKPQCVKDILAAGGDMEKYRV